MKNMNDFIFKNLNTLNDWMDELANLSGGAPTEDMEVPDGVIANALVFLHSHVNTNMHKIKKALEKYPPEVGQKLEQALAAIDGQGDY